MFFLIGENYDKDEYHAVKRDFVEIQTNNGIMVRSCANLIENDEKCIKYYKFRKEKPQYEIH